MAMIKSKLKHDKILSFNIPKYEVERHVIMQALTYLFNSEHNKIFKEDKIAKLCDEIEEYLSVKIIKKRYGHFKKDMLINNLRTRHKNINAKLTVTAKVGLHLKSKNEAERLDLNDGLHYFFSLQFGKNKKGKSKFKNCWLPLISGNENVIKFQQYMKNATGEMPVQGIVIKNDDS